MNAVIEEPEAIQRSGAGLTVAAPQRTKAPIDRKDRATVGEQFVENPRMTCRNVDVYYGDNHAIDDLSLDIGVNDVIAMIGPSGCGKSTFIRCLNRMNDTVESCRVSGEIKLEGADIYGREMDVVPLRAQVGMVFQKPNPFPKSIHENVAYGVWIHGLANDKTDLDEIVQKSLSGRACGTRSRTGWLNQARACLVGSNSGSASRAPSP